MHAIRTTLVLCLSVLAPQAARAAGVRVHLLDATVRDKAVPGAEVILQKNGEASVTGKSGADGRVAIPGSPGGADDASVTMIVKKAGYSSLVARCPCDGLTYALSPVMTSLDGMRIVLNWGAQPPDLDSHLVFEGQHVFWNQKKGKDVLLDVDDTSGYGPETITIVRKHPGVRYVYAVHDYTDGDARGTTALSARSQARVFVYVGSSLVRTFRPPAGGKGNLWVVFAVGQDGEFYDINTFGDTSDPDSVSAPLAQVVNGGALVSRPVMAGNATSLADDHNREGERLYHAKQLEDAVQMYQLAIDENPEHAQAYSNLGLAYQKLGRRAEAIWANRKALALAAGPSAAQVKASSHYNIARVYEEQGEWQAALDAFQQAQREKPHDAYVKGIARMQAKLGQ